MAVRKLDWCVGCREREGKGRGKLGVWMSLVENMKVNTKGKAM